MTRYLKAMGLALVAMLAMSAMAASGAQAEFAAQVTAEESPVTLDGTQEGLQVLTRDGRQIDCTTANFHAEGNSGDTTVAITPEYKGCTSLLGPATVTMNGCTYLFRLTADKVGASHTWTAVADLVCPAGKEVEIDIYTSHTNHTNNAPTCVYKFGDENASKEATNQGLKTIDLTNEPSGVGTPKDWIKADINVAGIHSKRTTGGALLCGKEVDTAGSLHGTAILKGTNADEEPNGITISTD